MAIEPSGGDHSFVDRLDRSMLEVVLGWGEPRGHIDRMAAVPSDALGAVAHTLQLVRSRVGEYAGGAGYVTYLFDVDRLSTQPLTLFSDSQSVWSVLLFKDEDTGQPRVEFHADGATGPKEVPLSEALLQIAAMALSANGSPHGEFLVFDGPSSASLPVGVRDLLAVFGLIALRWFTTAFMQTYVDQVGILAAGADSLAYLTVSEPVDTTDRATIVMTIAALRDLDIPTELPGGWILSYRAEP